MSWFYFTNQTAVVQNGNRISTCVCIADHKIRINICFLNVFVVILHSILNLITRQMTDSIIRMVADNISIKLKLFLFWLACKLHFYTIIFYFSCSIAVFPFPINDLFSFNRWHNFVHFQLFVCCKTKSFTHNKQ